MKHLWPIDDRIEDARRQAAAQAGPAVDFDSWLAWSPYPGPQAMALESTADIIGYGGAAGGGKTDLLLGAALLKHRRSIIFRREAEQLRDIIERSKELINDNGRLNENYKIWRDLPGDRRIEFGGVKNPGDEKRYRGRAHDLKGFDELTEFTELQFRFLIAWNRSTIPGQSCQVIAAFNPPTDETGQWVIRFFAPWIDPSYPGTRAMPGELRYFAMVDGKEIECATSAPFEHEGKTITPKSRTFIPARLEDNPALMAAGYGATLEALPEPLQTALRTGNFAVSRGIDPWAVIPRAWADAARARGRLLAAEGKELGLLSCMGIDPSRGGQDETAIARRYGQTFADVETWPGKEIADGPAVAALALERLADDCAVWIDAIGIGSSAYDQLAAVDNLRLTAGIASENSEPDATDRSGRLHFTNDRARWWWRFREALDPKFGDGIALPDDDALIEELCMVRYKVRSAKITIEDKEELKVRLGRSPNRADAVILAHQEHAGLMLW